MSDVEIEPCEICGSCDCLDAQIAYWFSRATRAEAAIAERDKQIEEIVKRLREELDLTKSLKIHITFLEQNMRLYRRLDNE